MAKTEKKNQNDAGGGITPEGEARLRSLVEGSARKLREGEERWEERQRQESAHTQQNISNNISESISDNISFNQPEKKRAFFDIPNEIPKTLGQEGSSSRLKLPPPVLHRVTPTSQTRGRPSFSGVSQQAVIKCLLDRGLHGTTYKQLSLATGVPQPNISRIVGALVKGGFVEKAVDKANRNVLIPRDIIIEIYDNPGAADNDISQSISENISHIISIKPSEDSKDESENHSIPSEVDKYQALLSNMEKERWKEMYPFLEKLGLTSTTAAKAFNTQRDKGMANVQTFQKALLKCEFEAQRVLEDGYQVLDKKGEPIKSMASFYRHTLAAYGDYRNPEGWVDPELARNRELIQIAEQIKAAREEWQKKFFEEWRNRLQQDAKTRLLDQCRKVEKSLNIVSDEMALKIIFEQNAETFIRTMQDDMFSAIPASFLQDDKN